MNPTKLVKAGCRALLRRYSPRLLYPVPTSALQPERLYLYLEALWQRRRLNGAIVEIGCWLGGTSAIAFKMLTRTGYPHRYLAVDTFEASSPSNSPTTKSWELRQLTARCSTKAQSRWSAVCSITGAHRNSSSYRYRIPGERSASGAHRRMPRRRGPRDSGL